jgi:cation diffusion facilitator CzcD-associated flavoprotein CzcO
MHTSAYRSPKVFEGKRVLIVGAGNSGCDIAVDAVHHAASVDLSVRRGYYFVPRYLFGRPSDTLNQGRPLPARIKQFVDTRVLRAFTGDPVRFGFPRPDYRLYESHPIVNTLILNHLGQGDLRVVGDLDRFDGSTVRFADGSAADYDLVMLATGYRLDYPFVDRAHLNWTAAAPELFLNVFPPSFNGLFVLGMIEASGIGWQGRYEQAELIAAYLAAARDAPGTASRFRDGARKPWPDLTGGYRYLGLDRMSYYVNKDAYRRTVRRMLRMLPAPSVARPPAPAASARTSPETTAETRA